MDENFDYLFSSEFPTKLKKHIPKHFLTSLSPYKIIIYDSVLIHAHHKSYEIKDAVKWAFKELLNIYGETLGKYKKVAFELELKDRTKKEHPNTLSKISEIMEDIYIHEYKGYDPPKCEFINTYEAYGNEIFFP